MIELAGAIFIIVAGCIGHFVYDWTNHNRIAAVFFAVNESTWEHIKLTIYPSILWMFVEVYGNSGNANIMIAQAASMLTMILMIPFLFYGYTVFTKKNYLIVDIFCFCISVAAGMLVFNRTINADPFATPLLNTIAAVCILAIISAYFIFSYLPPINFLFRDPITRKYGLSGHPCMHDHSHSHNGHRHDKKFHHNEGVSLSDANLEYLRKADKVYFVAMKEELDADSCKTEVVYTGVGKARATRGLLNYIRSNKELIEAGNAPIIVSLGTAGSAKFHRGDIVLCDKFHNNGDSFITETLEFQTLPHPTGHICASSDFFICESNFDPGKVSTMREKFDCLDMESYALANICSVYGLKFCAIKCISDGADESVESFDAALPKFRAKLNEFVKNLD